MNVEKGKHLEKNGLSEEMKGKSNKNVRGRKKPFGHSRGL